MDAKEFRFALRGLVKGGMHTDAKKLIDAKIRRLVADGTDTDEMRAWHRLLLDAAAAIDRDEDLKTMGWTLHALITGTSRHPPNETRLRERFIELHPVRGPISIPEGKST